MLVGAAVISFTVIGTVLSQGGCPDYANGRLNTAYSDSTGCIWADNELSHRFDNFDQALGRCK